MMRSLGENRKGDEMKRFLLLLLTFAMLLLPFSGCGEKQVETSPLLSRKDGVERVEVRSLPEGYAYAFAEEDAEAIVAYLAGLHLRSDFPENPDGYTGMTWVISLAYEDGEEETVYHFGNLFIRTEDGPWYQMKYEEANRFGALCSELNK